MKLGDIADFKGQQYELVGVRPYVRKMDGQTIKLWRLRSRCVDCGASFEFEMGTDTLASSDPKFFRRCLVHRRLWRLGRSKQTVRWLKSGAA